MVFEAGLKKIAGKNPKRGRVRRAAKFLATEQDPGLPILKIKKRRGKLRSKLFGVRSRGKIGFPRGSFVQNRGRIGRVVGSKKNPFGPDGVIVNYGGGDVKVETDISLIRISRKNIDAAVKTGLISQRSMDRA